MIAAGKRTVDTASHQRLKPKWNGLSSHPTRALSWADSAEISRLSHQLAELFWKTIMKELVLLVLSVINTAAKAKGPAGVRIAISGRSAQSAGTSLGELANAGFPFDPSSREAATGQASAKSAKSMKDAQVAAGDRPVDFIFQTDSQLWRA